MPAPVAAAPATAGDARRAPAPRGRGPGAALATRSPAEERPARRRLGSVAAEPRRLGMRFLARGESALRRGRVQEAINYAQAARAAGLLVRAHLLLGRAYLSVNRLDRARAEFDQVLRADPDNRAAREGRTLVDERARKAAPTPAP